MKTCQEEPNATKLVAGHVAVNLVTNVKVTLKALPPTVRCRMDSTVVLYYIKVQEEYRQYVSSRIRRIQQHEEVKWHRVPFKTIQPTWRAEEEIQLTTNFGNTVQLGFVIHQIST